MPWCLPGRAFVLGTALNKLHPVTLTPSELCDRAGGPLGGGGGLLLA